VNRRALLVLSLLLFCVGNTVGICFALTARKSLHVWDFQPLWQAGRWIVEGRGSPYADEMTRFLQMHSYGRLVEPGEDPRAFVYPLYVLLLVFPLVFLPLPWAQAAWFTMLEIGLVIGIIGAVRVAGWRPSARWTLLTVGWGFFLYPLAWALALGQVSILIFALTVAALLALQRGREGWAGILLAMATAKPQMSFLLVPALLAWTWFQRRWRFLLSFAGALGVLLALSFVVDPGWLTGALRAGAGYFEAQPFPSPVAMLGGAIAGAQGGTAALTLVVVLLAGLAWAWWQERRSLDLPTWAIGWTLVVTLLVAPRTSMVNQVSLLLPLCLLFAHLTRRGRWGRSAAVVIQIALLVGLWVIDLAWFPPLDSGEHWHAQQRVISPILPALLLLALATRPWWACKRSR
jgi:hypothetical protein